MPWSIWGTDHWLPWRKVVIFFLPFHPWHRWGTFCHQECWKEKCCNVKMFDFTQLKDTPIVMITRVEQDYWTMVSWLPFRIGNKTQEKGLKFSKSLHFMSLNQMVLQPNIIQIFKRNPTYLKLIPGKGPVFLET